MYFRLALDCLFFYLSPLAAEVLCSILLGPHLFNHISKHIFPLLGLDGSSVRVSNNYVLVLYIFYVLFHNEQILKTPEKILISHISPYAKGTFWIDFKDLNTENKIIRYMKI